MLSPLGIHVLSPLDLGLDIEVEETADTFAGNAALKATLLARNAGRPAMADDSGLVVDALGGDPGVRSARYGGEGWSDRDRYELLLKNMSDVDEPRRTARFVSVLALSIDGSSEGVRFYEGAAEGKILREPRGSHGFGYDPVFLDEASGLTFAEMEGEAKDAISHRGRALRVFLDALKEE